MIQRLSTQLPEWARSTHPHVRYELGLAQRTSKRSRYFQAIGLSILVVLLFVGGYLIGTNFLQNAPGQNLTEGMMSVLYWPTFGLQILLQFLALMLTINTISEQKRRLTWDNLRATEGGAGLAVRARWASTYYRLRILIGLIIGIRIILIAGILYDLTSFQGRYIDLLINNITPEVSPLIGAILLAFLMTASILIPLTGMGLDAAIGLVLAVNIQQRVYAIMTMIVLVAVRVLVVVLLMVGAGQFINGQLATIGEINAWLLMGGYSAIGDWGLRFLHLGFYSEVWATVPYAILFGIGLLIFALLQSALTEWLLAFTIRRAEQIG